MGLANWLTVLRILLIPVFITLLVYKQRGPALAVFLAAALTDLLDGYVARHRGSQSRLGAFLDPLADKLLLMASFVTLTWLKALPLNDNRSFSKISTASNPAPAMARSFSSSEPLSETVAIERLAMRFAPGRVGAKYGNGFVPLRTQLQRQQAGSR